MKNLNPNNASLEQGDMNRQPIAGRVRSLAARMLVVFVTLAMVLGTSPFAQLAYADSENDIVLASDELAVDAQSDEQPVAGETGQSSDGTDEQSGENADASAGDIENGAAEGDAASSDVSDANKDAEGNASAENSNENGDETTSYEEEGIALASDGQDDTVTPGTYGSYTYEQNTTKDAFSGSAYDAYRDPVATQWLGVAGSFHITAFDEMTISSHVYGNVLAKKLTGSNNYGLDTRYDNAYGYKGLSYIQEYPSPNGNVDGHNDGLFVIGSNNTVTKVDNGNHLAVNGVQFNQPNKLLQDTDTASAPFIDLDAVKTKTTEVSDNLAKVADVGASVSKEGSNTYINYEGDSGCAYVTFKASELNSMDQLYIKGMALNGSCSVVINVEMDTNDLYLSKVHVLLPDGQTAGTGETDSTVGYVMFNIKNSTSAMTISLSDRVLASVLAPNSTINLGGSAAGTYIGTKVNVTAESHARPFRGTLKPVVTGVSVNKQWLDAYGNPESADVVSTHNPVSVQLYQRKNGGDWAKYDDTVELSNANSWSHSWDGLTKKDKQGNTYEYKIEEVSKTDDYTSSVAGNDSGTSWTVTNRHVAVGKLSVSKTWDDEDDKDDVRPDSVTVHIVRSVNGGAQETYGDAITLNKSNGWAATVDQLPLKDADGNEYTYAVVEDAVDGYSTKVELIPSGIDADGNKSWTYTVINSHTSIYKETSVSVTKEWLNASGAAEIDVDHDPVSVQLYQRKNGGEWAACGDAVSLSNSNKWAYTWDKLVSVDGYGNSYEYKVGEVNVPVDYTSSVNGSGSTWTITNTHKAEKVDVKVKKVWQDKENKASKRPTSVTVQLYTVDAEGKLAAVEGKSAELKDGSWSAEWKNLPKNEAGKAISYTVRELDPETNEPVDEGTELSNGYKVTYKSDGYGTDTYSYTVTNTYEEEEQEFTLSGYSMAAEAAPVSEPDKVCYVDPKIYKKLEGRALKAKEFTFQLVNDKTGDVVSTAENDEAGMVDFDKAADKTGNLENPSCLEFTAAGTYTYTVRETTGYVRDLSIDYSTEVVKFVTTIGKDSNGALYEVESHYVVYPSQADADAKTNGKVYNSSEHPAITNKVKPLSIALTKTDADSGAKLAGATYGLYRVEDSDSDTASLVAVAVSDADGVMTFTDTDTNGIVANGTYYFQEISAPEGYAISEAKTCTFTIKQEENGAYSLSYDDGTVSKGAYAGTAADPIVFKPGAGVTDTKIAITFGKVSSDGTALSGAKLAVRDEAGNDVASWTTDGTGYVVNDLTVNDTYVLYEKTAPKGYAKAAEVTFTVDAYGKVSIEAGAESNDLLNAYATGSQLSLVDYKVTEIEDKETVVREEAVPSDKDDKSDKGGKKTGKGGRLPQTGEIVTYAGIILAVGACLVFGGLARRLRHKM